MARGKLERTKLKEAVITAVRETTAYQVAGQILEQSKTKAHEKKPLMDSFREHLGKWLDRVDPIELAAIAAATVIIHTTITGTEDLLNRVLKFSQSPQGFLAKPLIDTAFFLFGQVNYLTGSGVPNTFDESNSPDVLVWAISFVIAYIGIKNAGKIGSELLNMTGIFAVLGL
jgi:hypothetical protein